MSTLFLVRHAQASFFDENYDQLSPLGEVQARRLGVHFTRRDETFDEVYIGPAQRHRQSAEIVGEQFQSAGIHWPEPIVIDDLDEHTADWFLEQFAKYPETCPKELRELADSYREVAGTNNQEEIPRSFQRLFEAVVTLWTQARISSSQVGTWDSFTTGVHAAMKTMTTGKPSGSRILAFSSTGTITAALQYVLNTNDPTALQMGWRLRNCSLNRFIFHGSRITLDTFNNLSHLDEPGLITYR